MNDHDAIRPYLPTSGWLYDFIHFTDDLEACPRFRFFGATCVLGAAVNNRVWIQRGDPDLLPRLFPNIWILLLAPPERGHKTSTINMCCNALVSACPDVRVIADKITPESLVKALSAPATQSEVIRVGPRDATGLIKAPEISVFFGRQQYNMGLVSLITDLYDFRETWRAETIGRGKDILKNNCISVFGASTPSWLQSMLPEDAFTGGFMSRFVIVEMPPAYFKKNAFPAKPPDAKWQRILQGLSKIAKAKGEVGWTKESARKYEELCCSAVPTGDAQKDAYRGRVTEQVLKLGMALTLSDGRMTLEHETIDQARLLLQALEAETMPRIERLTTHPKMRTTQHILDILRTRKTIGRRRLYAELFRGLSQGPRELDEAIMILLTTRQIVETKTGDYQDPVYALGPGVPDKGGVCQ